MTEQPKQPEDLYEVTPLSDYINELSNLYLDQHTSTFKVYDVPLRTIEERYKNETDEEFLQAIQDHPKKIARVNAVVNMLNTTLEKTDIVTYKRAFNEIQRLVQGEERRFFKESEADPNLLMVEEEKQSNADIK